MSHGGPRAAESRSLPWPWIAVDNDDGRYYCNEETGESQWDYPVIDGGGSGRENEKRNIGSEDDKDELSQCHSEHQSAHSSDSHCNGVGPQREVPCFEVVPLGEATIPGGQRVRAVVADDGAALDIQKGVQAVLDCASTIPLRVEAVISPEKSGGKPSSDGIFPEDGDLFVELVSLDDSWEGLGGPVYFVSLFVIWSAPDVEEAMCSALRTLCTEVAADGAAPKNVRDPWPLNVVLSRAQDLFPDVMGDMVASNVELALSGSALFEVFPDSTIACKVDFTPLEETTLGAFKKLLLQESRIRSTERDWSLLADQLDNVLGKGEADCAELRRRLLESSSLVGFTFSHIRSHWVVKLTRPDLIDLSGSSAVPPVLPLADTPADAKLTEQRRRETRKRSNVDSRRHREREVRDRRRERDRRSERHRARHQESGRSRRSGRSRSRTRKSGARVASGRGYLEMRAKTKDRDGNRSRRDRDSGRRERSRRREGRERERGTPRDRTRRSEHRSRHKLPEADVHARCSGDARISRRSQYAGGVQGTGIERNSNFENRLAVLLGTEARKQAAHSSASPATTGLKKSLPPNKGVWADA